MERILVDILLLSLRHANDYFHPSFGTGKTGEEPKLSATFEVSPRNINKTGKLSMKFITAGKIF